MSFSDYKCELLHSILSRSYEIEHSETFSEETSEHLGIVDEDDRDIFMHRDAHFAGNFAIMIDYYKKKGRGAVLDVSMKRLKALEQLEKELERNLAPYVLSGADAEHVASAKKMYEELKTLTLDKNSPAYAISELIVAEKKEIKSIEKKVLSYKDAAIPPLIDIISSSHLKDPLFPGYGKAPKLGAKLLGELRAKEAIAPLFDLYCAREQEYDEEVAWALRKIGSKAKEFLKKRVKQQPVCPRNENALHLLLSFPSLDVAVFCFEELKLAKDKRLKSLLALGCEKLPKRFQEEFRQLAKDSTLSKEVLQEMQLLINYWDKNRALR
jgi:hypothetical protein